MVGGRRGLVCATVTFIVATLLPLRTQPAVAAYRIHVAHPLVAVDRVDPVGRVREAPVLVSGYAVDPRRRSMPRPYRKPPRHRSNVAAPILMYHVIAPAPLGAPFPGLYVPPAQFLAQMQTLARAGYRAVTLDRLRRGWQGTDRLPRHPIVITFDNGYRTQYTEALPILRRLGWVGDENLQLTGLPPREGGLTQREIVGLLRSGWELDTQGVSHADLNQLGAAGLDYQIDVARITLRRRYHVSVNWFCYPSGHYSPAVVAAVKEAGFLGATTVVPGWATPHGDRFRLPRLRVLAGTTPEQLLALITAMQHSATAPVAYPTGG